MDNERHHATGPSGERALVEAAWEQAEAARQAEQGRQSGPTAASEAGFGGPPPDSFTGYQIIKELHRGGQGVVYQAIQESTQRKVAIKVLREGPFSGAADRARFEREVQVLGQLNHPHIVAIHDTGSAAGHLYIVMDYIPGQSLDLYMAGGGHTVDDTLRLCAKICDAVNAAHLRGVIHRDLKPSNIRIDENGEPHVLDFGLAKVATSVAASSAMTLTGQFVGSLPWASPEQAEGAPSKVDLRTDVYALGVILYQVLTGRFPYPVIGNMRDVLDNILTAEPVRPSIVGVAAGLVWHGRPGRGINDEIDTIVLKCLQKDRDRRYQTAGELARDIRHYLAGEPIEAKRDSVGYVLRKQLRRYRVPAVIAAAFVLVVTVGFATSLAYWRQAVVERKEAQQAQMREAEQRRLAEDARHEALDNAEAARQSAEQARLAEANAERRAEELKQVADFQSSMLAETDVEGMGVAIVDEFEQRIRDVLADRMEDQEELDRILHDWRQQTLKAGPTNVALAVLDEFVLAEAAEAIEKDFADQPLIRASLLQAVADTLRELGLLDQARDPQERALEIRREHLGEEHPDTLSSFHGMGRLLHALGDLNGTEQFVRKALTTRRRVLGDDDDCTLGSMVDMAHLLCDMGRLPEAEEYSLQALRNAQRVHGSEHRGTLIAMKAMASVLESQGRLNDAERYLREALELSQRVLGDEHPETVTKAAHLGSVLHQTGNLEAAERYCRAALETSRRLRGDDHPSTLARMNNLGLLLSTTGKRAEAGALLEELLQRARRVLGEDHHHTVISMNSLAGLLIKMGRDQAAESLSREAVETSRRVLGDDHPTTLVSINNLALALIYLGKFDAAEPLVREVLETNRRVRGEDHPETVTAITNLGGLLREMGKPDEALPYYAEALESTRRALGADHPSTILRTSNMAGLLREMGRAERAEALGSQAVRGARKVLPAGHPRIGVYLYTHALALVDLAEHGAAETELVEAHQIVTDALGTQAPLVIEVTQAFVKLYDAWHAAEPDQGYDKKAAEWRAKLEEWQASTQPAEEDES